MINQYCNCLCHNDFGSTLAPTCVCTCCSNKSAFGTATVITTSSISQKEFIKFKSEFQEFKNRQIDENRKTSNQIEKLESYMKMEDRITAESILFRIDKIENDINKLMKTVEGIKKFNSSLCITRQPHRCPVCLGSCERLLQFGEPSFPPGIKPNCISCKGQGIVWG